MKVSLTSGGQLIASIPAQLGYVPTESVVFVLSREQVVTVTVRIDWPGAVALAARVVALAAETGSDTAYVVAISSEIEAYDQAGLAAVELDAAGLITHPIAVPVIGEGATWQHLVTGQRGLTEDYRTNPMTTAVAAEDGRYVAASRAELMASVATRTAPVDMTAAQEAAHADRDTFAAQVGADIVAVATGEAVASDELAARFGYLIVENVAARDALMWLVHTDAATAATNLTALAAPLRGPYRVQALTMLAALWTIASHSAAANAIISVVEAEGHPFPSMLVLLSTALRHGTTPGLLRTALTEGMNADSAADNLGGYRRP